MRQSAGRRSTTAWAALAIVLLTFAVTLDALAQPAPPAKESAEQVCKACHEPYFATYAASKHGTKTDQRAPATRGGCIACHGEGSLEHAAKGGGKGTGALNLSSKTVSPQTKNDVCLACHKGGKRVHWTTGTHAARDVTCSSCHTVHTNHDPTRDKLTQSETCFKCHKEQRVQINRTYRHPIREGLVACSDCHNPHGSASPKMMVRDNVNDTCYACHMDKRGPFVRTHQPVQEDCSICHNPHGTTNPNLLKARQPFLCQQCHEPTSHRGNFATLSGTSTGANTLARGCANCHTNIHGSNNPANISNERTFRR
ncbi:MAG TPA: DmsE family decaheme c-type cytochrome [Burkholderiales bacterium]|nr:DmsE family decaheme c-type cytochrome [Burkholderiales bacterium]